MTASAAERRERLVEVYREAKVCERCTLSATRNTVVFGSGDADAELMFVGEGPGAEEDRQGLPFVGRAGGLLSELLAGIGMSRDEVWITNVIRCRPPGNRDPHPEEIESCRPYTDRQFDLIEPTIVATLGNFATKLLTGNPTGITKVRGTPQVHELGGRSVYVMPLLHPASALRNPAQVEVLRGDFAALKALLDEPVPQPAPPEAGDSIAAGAPQPDQLEIFG